MNQIDRNFPVALPLLAAAAFLFASSQAQAVFLRGQPYTPAGADYSIFAVQGIDASNPQGQSGFNPQVNGDFEFPGSTGVSYDNGSGKLTDFGIGLYNNAQNQVQSTGLNIQYNQLVDPNSVTVTVEDFDIDTKSTFFNPNKVEPVVTIFGANHSVLGTANPTDVFPNLTAEAGKKDVWDLNLGALLSTLHISANSISGFMLSADMSNGEKPNSDPYLMISAGNGIPMVPEMGTFFPVIGLLVAVLSTQVLRRKKMREIAALQLSSK